MYEPDELPEFYALLEDFEDLVLERQKLCGTKNKQKFGPKLTQDNSKCIKNSHFDKKLTKNSEKSDSEKKYSDQGSSKEPAPEKSLQTREIPKILTHNENLRTGTVPKKKSLVKEFVQAREVQLPKNYFTNTKNGSSNTKSQRNTQDEIIIAQEPPLLAIETQILNLTVLENVAIPIPENPSYDLLAQTSETMAKEEGEKKTPGTSLEPKQKSRKPKNSKQEKFPAYLTPQEVEVGLKSGDLIKGIIRINPKNNRNAYVSNVDPLQEDYLLQPAEDRNRALEGDIVVIKLKPKKEWPKNKKTAIVVFISERIHSRITVGALRKFPDNNNQFGLLIPRDYRIPKIRVPIADCPSLFSKKPYIYKDDLFKAKITKWDDTRYAIGNILEQLGKAGDLEAETKALLIESDLDVEPFSNEPLEDLPIDIIEGREDLRKICIFTIDPETAHDLDDAVSCHKLRNGNFEVGVHISDVTYYLKEGTPLDKSACKKATTTYLVNKAFHMLPQELCSRSSLIPGMDKLTFSVIWELTATGQIIQQRFGRSVINSCVQLSYEHAQAMIDNPNHRFTKFPEIFGGFTYKDLSKSINFMHQIAVNLRAERFRKGALRIDQQKLIFQLNEQTGEPIGYTVYEYKEANELIEEFMLLANISVAHKIAEAFPNMAFLRCHGPPYQRLLVHWQKTLKLFSVDIDIKSSKALQSSITKLKCERKFGKLGMAVVKHFIIKPMVRARYFCAADTDKKEDFFHYSLHVPMYTHFTSPIRRYADITVHRLLSASLGYTKKHIWKLKYLATVANNCNKKKDSAKRAQEYSSDLYLAHYIEQHPLLIYEALVVDIKNNSFDVLVVAIGTVIRIYPKFLGDDVMYERLKEDNIMLRKSLLRLPKTSEFAEEKHVLHLFKILKVHIIRKNKTRRLEAKLVRTVEK